MYRNDRFKRTIEKATFDKRGLQDQINRCYKGLQEAKRALEKEKLPFPKKIGKSADPKQKKKETKPASK